MDFGLAKIVRPVATTGAATATATAEPQLTMTGSLIGTVPSMAPELLEGRAADPRTDVFALGCVPPPWLLFSRHLLRPLPG